MFEIILNESQLLKTFERLNQLTSRSVLEKPEESVFKEMLNDCRFLVITKNKYELFKELKSYGEDKLLWAGNQMECYEKLEDVPCHPFQINIDTNCTELSSILPLNLLEEKEIVVKIGETISNWKINNKGGSLTKDILVYDPYLIHNLDNSIITLKSLLEKIGAPSNTNLTLISSSSNKDPITKSKLELFMQGLEKFGFNQAKTNILVLSNVYHDRELIGGAIRLKSGGSFNFIKPGKTDFQNLQAMTIDFKALLRSDRMNTAKYIIDILFRGYENRYKKSLHITKEEIKLANNVEKSPFYIYWKNVLCN
jgi:hypothetical protein